MRGRAVIFLVGVPVLGAAMAVGCTKRALEPPDSGTGVVGPGAAGHAGGGGAAGQGDGLGGQGGIVPPGDLKRNAEACVSPAECASFVCADGVCCDSYCGDGCHRCDAPGTVGTCVALAAGETPKVPNTCPVEVALTCGNDGTCDGAGACRLRPQYTVCGPGSCDGDAVVGQMVCDGRGNCRAGSTVICVPYRCDPATAACKSTCATDTDCTNGYCETGGRCHMGGGGPPCRQNDECASGFCVAGVCCNSACDDPCMACNVRNWEGVCVPRPDGCPATDAGTD